MSIENAHAFMAKTESDLELQERIAQIATQSELTPEALTRLGEEIDLPFTSEEFLHASHHHAEASDKGISDASLDAVSGGVSSPEVIEKLKSLGKYQPPKTSTHFEVVPSEFIRPQGAADPH